MFETILEEIFTYLIIAGICGIGTFCTVVYRCVHKQQKRAYRQSQAILLLTKSIEEQTKRDHPDYHCNLHDEAKIILKDEKGFF